MNKNRLAVGCQTATNTNTNADGNTAVITNANAPLGLRGDNFDTPMKEAAPKRVLCVEDHEDTREMLFFLLRGEGFEVEVADSAREALEMARRRPFDLFILDVWLPHEDGNSLCRRLREFDPYAPVIVYSGAVFEADIEAARQAEADAFVGKPDNRELLEKVRYFLAAEQVLDGR